MTKLEKKPFALIGVNTNNSEPKQLKEVMVREKMNWRSFAVQETILEQWNNPGTPMYYVLDPRGVIRHKWVGYPGAKALDTALDELLLEAERTRKDSPK